MDGAPFAIPAYLLSVAAAAMMLVKAALWLKNVNGKPHRNGAESAAVTAQARSDAILRVTDKLEQLRNDVLEAHEQTRHDMRNAILTAILKSTEEIRYHIDLHMRGRP